MERERERDVCRHSQEALGALTVLAGAADRIVALAPVEVRKCHIIIIIIISSSSSSSSIPINILVLVLLSLLLLVLLSLLLRPVRLL